MTHDDRKSDRPIVPEKRPNKGRGRPRRAEGVEESGLAKVNPTEQTRSWTQSQADLQSALDRIRAAAQKDKGLRFTALWHHVYDPDRLRQSYLSLKRDAAPGVDGETWKSYGADLEVRLADLSERLKRGAYRAKPVKRAYIPKSDGRERPIGITTLEDKIVQRATVAVLNAIYETDFMGYSYGFRPGRSQHKALDAVTVGIERRKVNWVLDADIRGFFDSMSHEWTVKFIEHRIGDRRVVRHIKKWLNAGVLEDETWRQELEGVPQGGSVCPLLANVYLHYVLDLWAHWWRKQHATGEVIIVRYADDFLVGFQYEKDGKLFLEQLRERLDMFNLELHPEKTRLMEFGRYASTDRKKRGACKPETFNFLGFTHICGTTRRGKFCVLRKTSAKKACAKLREIYQDLRRRMHDPVPDVGRWLRSVLRGNYQYYAVPRNMPALKRFKRSVAWLWYQTLKRRSQKSRMTWERMIRLVDRWLPDPTIRHPYPDQRLRVNNQGRSPVR